MNARRDPEGIETRYLQDIGLLDGAHVLEIGSGDGRLTWRCAPLARRIVGLELDDERAQMALAERPPELRDRVDFIQADAQHLPFRKAIFDRAILAWSL